VSVTEAERFVHRTAMLICCSVSVIGLRRPIYSKLVTCVEFETVEEIKSIELRHILNLTAL
jgi:hypothetical protein